MTNERAFSAPSGWVALPVILLGILTLDVTVLWLAVEDTAVARIVMQVPWLLLTIFLLAGLFVVNPNQARVVLLFGRYKGTVKEQGLHWANPLLRKRKVSLRVRNFETERAKVNDADGNPIEMASVVVWKVVDTAEASFEVDDYVNYVHVQSESALRNLATLYPYDTHNEGTVSLRGNTDEIATQLQAEVQGRLNKAGVEVLEARITHLAYAPEIASAMLQRQQAGAIIAARTEL